MSELLSKPKSWDKLTEKGRDSYRKMHAWCHDDQVTSLFEDFDANEKHDYISFAGNNAAEDLDSAKGGTCSARFICIHGRQM